MGIRNLAFCLIRHDSLTEWTILAWDNIDLLSGGVSAQDARRCVACSSPAVWEGEGKLWCKACATGVRRKKSAKEIPTLSPLPCGVSVKELRELGAKQGWDKKITKKADLLPLAASQFLMPWKAPKATQPSLQGILKAMDVWLDKMLPIFSAATLIRLENQPVMKGPTMKSIQIMLFTLLSHRLSRETSWAGSIEFVHAGTKTRDSEEVVEGEVDEGKAYRARKKTAETETRAALLGIGESQKKWLEFFDSRSKKNDLADSFLMALRAA